MWLDKANFRLGKKLFVTGYHIFTDKRRNCSQDHKCFPFHCIIYQNINHNSKSEDCKSNTALERRRGSSFKPLNFFVPQTQGNNEQKTIELENSAPFIKGSRKHGGQRVVAAYLSPW